MDVLARRAKPLNLPLNRHGDIRYFYRLNAYTLNYSYRSNAARSIVQHSKANQGLVGYEYPSSIGCRFRKQVLSIVELPILI